MYKWVLKNSKQAVSFLEYFFQSTFCAKKKLLIALNFSSLSDDLCKKKDIIARPKFTFQ